MTYEETCKKYGVEPLSDYHPNLNDGAENTYQPVVTEGDKGSGTEGTPGVNVSAALPFLEPGASDDAVFDNLPGLNDRDNFEQE